MALELAAASLLGAGFTQADRLLDLTTPLGQDKLLAERLRGTEQLSDGGFVLHVDALSDDAHIPLKSLIGQAAQVKLRTALGPDEHRVWCGLVTEARFEGANGGFARYRLRIEPWLALLRQRRDWDRDHQVTPPPPAACLPCAVAVDQCPTHADRRCRACGGQLHRIVVDEGFDTHPCCDRPGGAGSLAVLEHTARMLGATLLAQPA